MNLLTPSVVCLFDISLKHSKFLDGLIAFPVNLCLQSLPMYHHLSSHLGLESQSSEYLLSQYIDLSVADFISLVYA